MGIIVLILGVLAIGAAFAYYMLMLALVVLAVIAFVGFGLVMFAYEAAGPLGALVTGVGYIGLAILIYTHHIEEQRKAEEERKRREEAIKAAEAAETERLRQEAVQKPWHDRNLKDWRRVWF